MTMDKIKLKSALPKNEANGFNSPYCQEIADTVREGRRVRPRVALVIVDGGHHIDPDGTETVVLRILRTQPVITPEGRMMCEQLLVAEYLAQTGAHMLPYELDALSKTTFEDLPKTAEQIDEDQNAQRENMSPLDELKQHMRVVHGVEANSLTEGEARKIHDADHADEGAAMADGMGHDVEWHGWTRTDLELAEIQSDEYVNVDEHLDGAGTVHPAGDDEPTEGFLFELEDEDSTNVQHVDFSGPR